MTQDGFMAVMILIIAVILLVKKWIPVEITALGVPVVLVLTGVLEPEKALEGFGNLAVLALGAIFIIGAGLREAGVTTAVARVLQRVAGTRETLLVFIIMVVAACVSAFMSNAATTAVFVPAVVSIGRKTGISPSRLLMPLAFAAVLGGNLTAIGTASNLVLTDLAPDDAGLSIFAFSKVGLPVVLAGIAFMMIVGRRQLPDRGTADRLREARLPENAAATHGLAKTLFRMKIVAASKIRGRTVAEAGIRKRYGLEVVSVMRPRKMGNQYLDPTPDLCLAAGDELYLKGDDENAWQLSLDELVQFGLAGPEEIERLLGRGIAIAEVALPPRSSVFGRSLKEIGFRNRFHLNVLSIWRDGAPVTEKLADEPLKLGDALLISGRPERVTRLATDPNYLVLTDSSGNEDLGRAPMALFFLLLAIVPAIFTDIPLAISALGAAVLMVASGCLSVSSAHRAIDWRVLFLIMGTIPLGGALDETGVAETVAQGLLEFTGSLGAPAILATLYVLSAALAITTSNAAAATIIAPIAISAAGASAGLVSSGTALLAVAYGCSCAFILPYHQWNLMIMGPGAYKNQDFLRVGWGMSLTVAVTAIVLLSLLN